MGKRREANRGEKSGGVASSRRLDGDDENDLIGRWRLDEGWRCKLKCGADAGAGEGGGEGAGGVGCECRVALRSRSFCRSCCFRTSLQAKEISEVDPRLNAISRALQFQSWTTRA